MQTDGFKARRLGLPAYIGALRGGDIIRVFIDRKGRVFDPGIAQLARELESALEWPLLKRLVANCELHLTSSGLVDSEIGPGHNGFWKGPATVTMVEYDCRAGSIEIIVPGC
jgi:hypothetical protein